jgi:hypothetical protein
MSYYTDHDDFMGQCEEAEEHMRELEYQKRQKKKNFDAAVAAEVKRQLDKNNIQPISNVTHNIDTITQIKPKPISRGKTVDVKCACCCSTFKARVADVKRGWGKFCSKRCKAVKQEKETGQFMDYLSRELSR